MSDSIQNAVDNIDEPALPDVPPEMLQTSVYAAKNTPFNTLLKLKEKHPNISAKNLGKLVGISKQAVCQMFARHGINFDTGEVVALQEYKVNRADIMAVKQIECMNAIDHRKLKKASARDLAIVFGTLYDKERLERGQSTQNVATILASAAIEAGKQWSSKAEQTQYVVSKVIDTECT